MVRTSLLQKIRQQARQPAPSGAPRRLGRRSGQETRPAMRPPFPFMPPAPPLKAPSTAFQLAIKAEELIKTSQQQKARLKKLYGARKNPRDLDEDTDSETQERDPRSNRNLDFLACDRGGVQSSRRVRSHVAAELMTQQKALMDNLAERFEALPEAGLQNELLEPHGLCTLRIQPCPWIKAQAS